MITAEEARKRATLNVEENAKIELNRAESQIMNAVDVGRYSTRVDGISDPDRLKAAVEPLGYHVEVYGDYLVVMW